MSLSCAHLARALAKGPVVLEGTFALEMRPQPRRASWTPPSPLPWIVRADPIVRLCVMMGAFAMLTLILHAVGFLY